MNKWIKTTLVVFIIIFFIFVLFLAFTFTTCKNQESRTESKAQITSFNSDNFIIPDKGGKKMRGQVIYMPVYSTIPYQEKRDYMLSPFLAIHNTDLKIPIKITKVIFFNTDGKTIRNFFSEGQQLNPLATVILTVPQKDQKGVGDNFLIEWMADQPVNEPLVESVMKDLSGNLGMSFLSTGRVIREIQ